MNGVQAVCRFFMKLHDSLGVGLHGQSLTEPPRQLLIFLLQLLRHGLRIFQFLRRACCPRGACSAGVVVD